MTTLRADQSSLRLRIASIAVDPTATVLILVPSTLWAKPSYLGFLTRPDPGIFLIIDAVAGFRLSRVGVWVGEGLAVAGAGAIIALDFAINRARLEYGPDSVVVYFLLLGASVGVGMSIHKKVVELVQQGARALVDGERARQRFGVYLSQELVDEALSADELRPGGRRQPVAVLFSDLRGFTTYSESLAPEALVDELNAYLEAMVREIRAEGGVIDKYIGDAIMVVFGIPSPRSGDAERAVRCAWRMDRALADHNSTRRRRGLPPLRHGVGVHYGESSWRATWEPASVCSTRWWATR